MLSKGQWNDFLQLLMTPLKAVRITDTAIMTFHFSLNSLNYETCKTTPNNVLYPKIDRFFLAEGQFGSACLACLIYVFSALFRLFTIVSDPDLLLAVQSVLVFPGQSRRRVLRLLCILLHNEIYYC